MALVGCLRLIGDLVGDLSQQPNAWGASLRGNPDPAIQKSSDQTRSNDLMGRRMPGKLKNEDSGYEIQGLAKRLPSPKPQTILCRLWVIYDRRLAPTTAPAGYSGRTLSVRPKKLPEFGKGLAEGIGDSKTLSSRARTILLRCESARVRGAATRRVERSDAPGIEPSLSADSTGV